MAKFFINRPIVAISISIMIVILGAMSILNLPLAQYPNIIPPQIGIDATYPGGDCATIAESIATPIEEQIMGVENMDYVTSTNGNDGRCSINVSFKVGTDPNEDMILTQMRYGQAQSQLPNEVQRAGVNLRKKSAMPIILISLYSENDSVSALDLSNFANIRLVDELKRVPGVSDVSIFGNGKYAMRIWLDPLKMASLNITTEEVIAAVSEQNTVTPAGMVGGEPAPPGTDKTFTVRTQGRLNTDQQFGDIILRSGSNGEQLYLRDIARIELGADSYGVNARTNGKQSATVAIFQDPAANAITTADAVQKRMSELQRDFLPGMTYKTTLDTTRPIRDGIREILSTLIEALVLVVLVVFIFLQGWRATIIPLFAVPVSIIGTFALFPLFGFSINTICLMAVILSIGLVVDDAIVVVEAVEHHMARGLSAKDATRVAMEEVSGPVVAIALVLSAVFLPSLILPGISGSLFQQFALTISAAIMISAFNALSLSPALSAMLLKTPNLDRRGPLTWFYRFFNKGFDKTANFYTRCCGMMMRKVAITIIILGGLSALIYPMSEKIPGGFLPQEDQGYMMGFLSLPAAASAQLTSEAAEQMEAVLQKNPNIENVVCVMGLNLITGVRSPNSAFFFISLIPSEERKETAMEICKTLMAEASANVYKGFPFLTVPPSMPGTGVTAGVDFVLQDTTGRGTAFLLEQAAVFKEYLDSDKEYIASVMDVTGPDMATPQINVEIDRQKAQLHHVSVGAANGALKNYLGSFFVNYVSMFGKQWPVYLQAEPEARNEIEKIKNFTVKSQEGDAVPLSAITNVTTMFAPNFIQRQNRMQSHTFKLTPQEGISTAQVMKRIEEKFAELMPAGVGMDYKDMSFQEKKAQEGISLMGIFALSAAFTFLILAALYESWASPLSIFMTVPIAVIGAMAALISTKLELNIYAEIGMIMLIGLAAKNAILIVEFAELEMRRGKGLYEACLSGARIRLRPILMTSFAFIFGCVPLAIATGSGAMARRVIGTVVIGGMTTATLLGIFFVPACFYAIKRLTGVKSGRI